MITTSMWMLPPHDHHMLPHQCGRTHHMIITWYTLFVCKH